MGGRTIVRQCSRSQEGLGGSAVPRQTGRETRTWRALWPGLAGERSLQRELHTRARGYHDVTILGLDGALVEVEVDLSPGMPAFKMRGIQYRKGSTPG